MLQVIGYPVFCLQLSNPAAMKKSIYIRFLFEQMTTGSGYFFKKRPLWLPAFTVGNTFFCRIMLLFLPNSISRTVVFIPQNFSPQNLNNRFKSVNTKRLKRLKYLLIYILYKTNLAFLAVAGFSLFPAMASPFSYKPQVPKGIE